MSSIIGFQLSFHAGPPADRSWIEEPNRWREILRRHGLLGQDPARYGGFGFGNVSRRLPPWDAPAGHRRFLITASQTGHLDHLEPEHFTLVLRCAPADNQLEARGAHPPSSESITHGMLYDLDPGLRYVMHVHSADLWLASERLGLTVTDPRWPYGSPELARDIAFLYRETDLPQRHVLAMGGHRDGLISFGKTADEAGSILLDLLAQV